MKSWFFIEIGVIFTHKNEFKDKNLISLGGVIMIDRTYFGVNT